MFLTGDVSRIAVRYGTVNSVTNSGYAAPYVRSADVPLWLRINNDTTNYNYLYSPDGMNWVMLSIPVGNAVYSPAHTNIGFGGNLRQRKLQCTIGFKLAATLIASKRAR